MTELDSGGCRRLVAATVLHALREAEKGASCNGHCHADAHHCASDALRWLSGPEASEWLDVVLNLSPAMAQEWAKGQTELI